MQASPDGDEVYTIFQRVLWRCFIGFFILPLVLYVIMFLAAVSGLKPAVMLAFGIHFILSLYLRPVYHFFGPDLFIAYGNFGIFLGLAPKGAAGFLAVIGFYTVVSFLLAGLAKAISAKAKKGGSANPEDEP